MVTVVADSAEPPLSPHEARVSSRPVPRANAAAVPREAAPIGRVEGENIAARLDRRHCGATAPGGPFTRVLGSWGGPVTAAWSHRPGTGRRRPRTPGPRRSPTRSGSAAPHVAGDEH